MTGKHWTLATLTLFALAIQPAAGADEGTGENDSAGDVVPTSYAAQDSSNGAGANNYNYVYPWGPTSLQPFGNEAIARFGWWATDTQGDRVKINEYQKIDPSPFWDLDGIFTDGTQTLDFVASQFDNEANSVRARYYQPRVSVDFEYDRFFRAWDHRPLYDGLDNVVTDDLNLGEDYAIRVQELKASAKGRLGENVRWRLNVWGLRRSGERQTNALAHCFSLTQGGGQQNVCHLQSQRQRIDWTIMEIEPVVEARFDNFSVEYRRTMRSLGTDDQPVFRTYSRFGFVPDQPYQYAFVPENYTAIDRLRISSEVFDDTYFYANMYYGDTENKFRDTHRTFSGVDLRLTNNSFEGLNITFYGKMLDTQNELPPFLLPEDLLEDDPATPGEIEGIRHPVDYTRLRAGVRSRWSPFVDDPGILNGLFVTAGYEYLKLSRDFAVWESRRLGRFEQPDTRRHQIEFGPTMKWGQTTDTYIRYKGRFTEDPLIGVRNSTGRFNTNQPEREHGIDIGGTWMPTENFMAMAQFSMVNAWNDSRYSSEIDDNRPINFSEDSYPIVTSLWYAPTEKLSLSGGYSYFSNWIEQDISQGFRTSPVDTSEWLYSGEAHVVNFNANYAWTCKLKLVGGCEWVRGTNAFSAPGSTTGADWSTLPMYSDVVVRTTRILTGVDYEFRPGIVGYLRYQLFDYEDESEAFNSGTGNMFLAGASASY